jgi:hypothetical protein
VLGPPLGHTVKHAVKVVLDRSGAAAQAERLGEAALAIDQNAKVTHVHRQVPNEVGFQRLGCHGYGSMSADKLAFEL